MDGLSAGRAQPTSLLVWETLASRRVAYANLVWQTPALGMTAQAFLLTLALGPGTAPPARVLAALLSTLLSIMILQLMWKHRWHEVRDSRLLAAIEKRLEFKEAVGFIPHGLGPERTFASVGPGKAKTGMTRWWRGSSVTFWMAGQSVFAATSLGIVVLVITGNVLWLSGP